MLEQHLRSWDGEELVARFDKATSTWMFIGVHSTALGPAMGGTRMKSYPSPDDAVRDVLRLSQAMSMKQAAAGLPYGGGKAVLAVPAVPDRGTPERAAMLDTYAALVDSLHGTYVTAADMNTGPADMDAIGERTPHVLGRSPTNGGAGDPGEGTAIGLFHAVRATCRRAFGSDDLSARTVAVQGVGSVGARLIAELLDAGAKVMAADYDAARVAATGAIPLDAEAVLTAPCDLLAPCATGAVLNEETIPELACHAIAGAANNQLATPEDAARLAARDILYAPDYVANAGGVIWLAGYETLGWDDAHMRARLAGIEQTLEEIFAAAADGGITTAEAADRIALERIAAAGRA
ncbi:MAG TPA: Glu/Leu/Phe/Val dehydrogenase dimerization domain-containing protein [Actinomycetota bacterium]|jgi:leucine dehydrogenase|nr:Glu/Leu/Phe/Val dehydrogenase dimerization domain-containing protein [Actinomycetota bacterium]